MTITAPWAKSGPASALKRAGGRSPGRTYRNIRLTAAILVALMFGCFATATILQMRRDHVNALALAASYADAQAQVLASETGRSLDRLAALGIAYVSAVDGPSAANVILAADSDRILNIALADADGNFIAAMMGRPLAAKPLSEPSLARLQVGRSIEPYSDPAIGSSPLTLLFQADNEFPPRFVVVPLDPNSLLPESALGETALFTPSGLTLALGDGWEVPPPSYVLRADAGNPTSLRTVEYEGVRRIIALSPVPGWPLAAAASVRTDEALASWYGSLPIYLFVIFGPALAGLGIAFLMVREFERADRARSALVAAKVFGAQRPPDAPAKETELLSAILAEAEQRAGEADRAKAEFTALISHELRTPLNAIVGFSEMIQSGFFGPPGHPKYTEYAGDIASAARDLHTKLGDILDYAEVEGGRRDLRPEPVHIGPEVKACIDRIRGQALARKISVNWNLPELPLVRADIPAVKRILTIILSNALRYTPDGGKIRVDAHRDEHTVVLKIWDSGQGFSPEEVARAGEPYVRFPRPGAEGSGLGLGLAMAMNLARRMGGALRLAGATGEGTWAELRLPIE